VNGSYLKQLCVFFLHREDTLLPRLLQPVSTSSLSLFQGHSLHFCVSVLAKLSTPFFPWGSILSKLICVPFRISNRRFLLDCIPFVRYGLYQLVIRVKGIRLCTLHCVRAVTSIRIAFEVLSCRRGLHTFSESSFLSLAHGPRWLFLLSRHRKAISAAANQKPFCK